MVGTVDVGTEYLTGTGRPAFAGVFLPDPKHLGIGVGDMALIKPTGDPAMSRITRGSQATPGLYISPWMGVPNVAAARVATDGNWYAHTLNPVMPALVVAAKELIISDLAGNAGPLVGTFDLTPLLDLQRLAQTGSGNVGG